MSDFLGSQESLNWLVDLWWSLLLLLHWVCTLRHSSVSSDRLGNISIIYHEKDALKPTQSIFSGLVRMVNFTRHNLRSASLFLSPAHWMPPSLLPCICPWVLMTPKVSRHALALLTLTKQDKHTLSSPALSQSYGTIHLLFTERFLNKTIPDSVLHVLPNSINTTWSVFQLGKGHPQLLCC